MGYLLDFLDDPHEFLAEAGPLLAAEPVRCTVIASVTARLARADSTRPADAPAPWWLVLRDDSGRPISAAMRTAPLPPYPPYLLAMPDDAAVLLARTLHERGEVFEVVNGFLPTLDVFVAEVIALSGGVAHETERTSLYEVVELVEPSPVEGRLRIALEDELDLVLGWFDAFGPESSEQAGRAEPHAQIETRESTRGRILSGDIWLWETPEGTPVQVTAFNPPSFGVGRVGPVYTPKEHRGHGYAAAGVATITRWLLDEGARVCLFADAQNQTSTGVYLRLGYRPLAATGGLRIVR